MTDQLTIKERTILAAMPKLHLMDANSQRNLRAKVDHLRKTSKPFSEAFDEAISSIPGVAQKPPVSSIFGSVADVVTHPITALKAKIGEKGLEKRNKAPVILAHPDPKLKRVAKEVNFAKESKEDLMDIVRKLGAALREVDHGDRLGIAAPQIGIDKRIFVCQGAVCINPEWVLPKVSQTKESLEGCYSVKGKLFKVKRDSYGWATWYSVDGVKREFKLSGLDAIIYQHELAHLNGQCVADVGVELVREPLTK
jgi:peptide deformylase